VKITGSRFEVGEEVVLRCDKRFLFYDALGRRSEIHCKGRSAEITKIEPLYDDHGRFTRFWYHLKGPMLSTSIAEEDEIGKSGILERMADIYE